MKNMETYKSVQGKKFSAKSYDVAWKIIEH